MAASGTVSPQPARLALWCAGLVGVAGVATITGISIPTANSVPVSITAGPDGAIWFTEAFGNKIGRTVSDPVWSAAVSLNGSELRTG